MVEVDNETDSLSNMKSPRDKTCLRINVKNVREACVILDKHSIDYTYKERDWRTIAKLRDPDSNLIGIRSAE
jgi:hypothetical protein